MKLTRIQMVVYLQAVDLFTYCTAEQMVRIAGIARQQIFKANEKIYASNDPADAMYCVAEGEVCLESAEGGVRTIGAKETFGVQEILSDRLRREDAWATRETLALAIDAEDFFDLLSHNIEIVKALFRQLLRNTNEDVSTDEIETEGSSADTTQSASSQTEAPRLQPEEVAP